MRSGNLEKAGHSFTKRTRNLTLTILLAATINLLIGQPAAQSEPITPTVSSEQQIRRQVTSPADVLIVELKPGADRQQFDDLLQEVHGTYIRTINAGSSLQFLVIQAAPGTTSDVEKKLRADKNIAVVARNQIYRIHSGLEPVSVLTNGRENEFLPSSHKIGKGAHPHNIYGHHSHRPQNPGSPPPIITGVPSDPYNVHQWDLAFMKFNDARDSGNNTSNVARFCFLDTGFNSFEDAPVVVTQYNFAGANPPGTQEAPFDSGFHGTATASVLAWTDNNIGLSGAANLEGQRCELTELRISEDGKSASLLSITDALSFVVSNPSLRNTVVNLSFALRPPNTANSEPMIQQLAAQLQQQGSLLVLAAGNYAVQDPSPEQYARRVAAIDQSGKLAPFSDFGPFYAAAPGARIAVYLPAFGNAIFTVDGTSLAAPRWTAAIGIVMAAANITAVQADQIITQTATINPQGYRVPNLRAALHQATGI
jgi:hypothetical protein